MHLIKHPPLVPLAPPATPTARSIGSVTLFRPNDDKQSFSQLCIQLSPPHTQSVMGGLNQTHQLRLKPLELALAPADVALTFKLAYKSPISYGI